MAGRFERSWALTKQSWAVLKQDKHLMLFPVISGSVMLLLLTVSVGGSIWYSIATGQFDEHNQERVNQIMHSPAVYAGLFVFYFISNFIVIYFNAGLVACVMNRFNGQDSSFSAGLAAANSRLPKILAWAAVNATVGVLMKVAEDKLGWIGKLILRGIAFAWNVATFFVVPVLVVDNVGPIDAVKKSVEVLKKSWGESLIVQSGISLVMVLATMLVLTVGFGAAIALGVTTQNAYLGIGLGVATFIVAMGLGLISTTMRTILVAACYRYATTGQAPGEFQPDTLQSMFRVKGR